MPIKANEWLIDSGASAHMCNNRALLTNIRSIPPSQIIFGGGKSIESNKKGDMEAKFICDDGEFTHTVRDVLFAPDLKNNLLSMLHLNKQGIETSNNKNGVCSLIIDKRVVGKIKHRGNMLPIKLAPVKESQVQYANKAVTNNDKKVLLWHHRVGHVNANTMKDCTNQGEEDDKYNDNKKIISWPLSPTVIGQSFIEP